MKPLLYTPPLIQLDKMVATSAEYFGNEQHNIDIKSGHDLTKGLPYSVIAQINGDWLDDLDTGVQTAYKTMYTERENHPDYLYISQVSENEHLFKTLPKIPLALGFEDSFHSQIQMQRTGCLMPKHVDPLSKYAGGLIHVLVTLSDWEQGQLMCFNDVFFTHWKSGMVIYTDFARVSHWTANCSWHTRPLLQILGRPGPYLQKLIQSTQPAVIDI